MQAFLSVTSGMQEKLRVCRRFSQSHQECNRSYVYAGVSLSHTRNATVVTCMHVFHSVTQECNRGYVYEGVSLSVALEKWFVNNLH